MKIKLWHALFFIGIIVAVTIAVFPSKKKLISLYIESQKIDKAESAIEIYAKDNPKDPDIQELSAKLFRAKKKYIADAIGQKEYDRAQIILNQMLKEQPNDPELIELSDALLNSSIQEDIERAVFTNDPEAVYAFLRKRAVNGDKLDVLKMLKAATYTNNPATMIEAADIAGQILKSDRDILIKRSEVYLASDSPLNAYSALRELAAGGNEDDVHQMLRVAEYTGSMTILREAQRAAYRFFKDRAVSSKGNDALTRKMIQYAELTKDPVVMKDACDTAILFNPQNPFYLLKLSDVYLSMGEEDKAIDVLEAVYLTNPKNAYPLILIGLLYEKNRKPRQAMSVWERISEIDFGEGIQGWNFPDYVSAYRSEKDFPESQAALWHKLADYYHFYGMASKEVNAIIRVLSLEKDAAPDYLSELLTSEMKDIVYRHQDDLQNAPFMAHLLSGLFQLRSRHVMQINTNMPPEDIFLKSLIHFVNTGYTDRGVAFAENMDQRESSLRGRLQMVKILRWNSIQDKARDILHQLVEIEPDNNELLILIGDIEIESGRFQTAFQAYMKVTDPSLQDEVYLNKIIFLAENLGKPDIIESTIRLAVSLKPEDPQFLRKGAELYIRVSKPEKAYPLFLQLSNRTKTREDVLMMLTTAGYTGKKNIMEDAVRQASVFRPDDPEVLEESAKIALWSDNPMQAYRFYSKVASLTGDREKIFKMIEISEFTGNPLIHEEALLHGQNIRRDDPDIRQAAADFYLAHGRQQNAIDTYQEYLMHHPEDDHIRIRLAKIYQGQAHGGDNLRQILSTGIKTDNKDILLQYAGISEQADLPEQTYRIYKKLFGQNPEDHEIQERFIRYSSWAKQEKDAAQLLAALSDADPKNFMKAFTAGITLIEKAGRTEKGIFYIERALSLNPGNLSLRRNLAKYYGWAGKTEKLISEMEYLASGGLLSDEDKLMLAQAYLDKSKGKNAVSLLKDIENEKTLSIDGGIKLATAYEMAGQFERAAKIYKRLSKENAQDAQLLAEIGKRALWIQRTDLALQFYQKALRKDPKNQSAIKGSAQIYAWNNDQDRAIRLFELYNRLNPNDFEVRYQLGELYFSKGLEDHAFREYKKTLELIKQ